MGTQTSGQSNPKKIPFYVVIVSAMVLLSGVVVFTFVVFRLLERLHGQLVALNEAAITVTADLSVDRVLERVAELAGTVAGAAYASVQAEGEPGKAVSSGAARRCRSMLIAHAG